MLLIIIALIAGWLLFIALIGLLSLAYASFALSMGRKMRGSGIAIAETGIAPAQSGFNGQPDKDTSTPRFFGHVLTFYGYLWSGSAYFALATAGLFIFGGTVTLVQVLIEKVP